MSNYRELMVAVKICRPAFQDFHRLLGRYYSRSELIRQLQKLQWWDHQESMVIDLAWKAVPGTELSELVIESCDEFGTDLRILFFAHSPLGALIPSIWILGGMNLSEAFDEDQKIIYVSRSVIVKERATE